MPKNVPDKDDAITLAEFSQFMYHKIVPLSTLKDADGKPLAQFLPYWRRHGLLPFIPKGSWIEISFAQLIWIRILDTLRTFGYPLKNMKTACDYFFKDAYYDGLPEKNIKHNKEQIEKKKIAGTITEQETLMLNEIDAYLSDDVLLYILKYDINYLTFLVTRCLSEGKEAGILLFADGNVAEHIGGNYFSHKNLPIDPAEPHIYLSIRHYLMEFIDSEELNALIMPQLINDDEANVLNELRKKNIKEIIITRNGKDLTIASTKSGTITGEQVQEIKRILGLGNYEKIELNTRDEKTLSFKRIKKINVPG
jgi:hypothetical protein